MLDDIDKRRLNLAPVRLRLPKNNSHLQTCKVLTQPHIRRRLLNLRSLPPVQSIRNSTGLKNSLGIHVYISRRLPSLDSNEHITLMHPSRKPG